MRLSRLNCAREAESSESCRLCLGKKIPMLPLFAEQVASAVLRSRILDCCPIQLFENEALPKMICAECERKLTIVYEFRQLCRETERKLRKSYEKSYRKDCTDLPIFRETCIQTNALQLSEPSMDIGIPIVNTVKDGIQEYETRDKKIEHDITEISDSLRNIKNDRDVAKETISKEILGGNRNPNWDRTRDPNQGLDAESLTLVGPKSKATSDVAASGKKKDRNLTHSFGIGENSEINKQYLCDICSKTFASKSGLRFHLKAHGGVKPHICRYCGKAFAIPSYAKRHERIHAGDKRFVCHICSAAFASSNGLKYHLRSHTGEANYRCDTCGKSFGRCKYLKEHMFTHTGEKPFVCKICGSAYGNSGSLFVHQKKCKDKYGTETKRPSENLNPSYDIKRS